MNKIDDTLRTLLFDTVEPNHLQEVARLKQYMDAGCPHGEPLFLSLGETWEHTPHALRTYLGDAPAYTHGYQLSMYGLPEIRQLAATYIEESHRLKSVASRGTDYEVAISWTGTRNAMYDYGRLLKDEYFTDTPTIITTAPGWDYPGVFGSLGYEVAYVHLDKQNAFQPDVSAFEQVIQQSKGKALLIINAQHNPTSINWSVETVRDLIRMALGNSLAILIDDAHYGVCHPDIKPTSSLAILLEELQKHPGHTAPWMAVRSFGKQFGYAEEHLFMGDCTNFVLFSVPHNFASQKDGVRIFLEQCLSYGIVLTDAWPKPYDTQSTDTSDNFKCIRLFAGASSKTIQTLLERLKTHSFHYRMEHFH